MRSLAEMKIDRGGRCYNCRKDIMAETEKDHSYCNKCWWNFFAHPYITSGDGTMTCDQCGYGADNEYHLEDNPYD